MGSWVSSCNSDESCDTCYGSSIDTCIEQYIYYPPDTLKEKFSELNTDRSQLIMCDNVSLVKVLPENKDPNKTIVFSHGNGTDIYTFYPYLEYLADMLQVCVVCYDYPGYGLSTGIASEQGCYASLTTTMRYVKETLKVSERDIYLVGQSLGTGVVIDYAVNNAWFYPIILISPYKSICRVMLDSCVVSPIDKFDSLSKIRNVMCPVKIFHGKQDTLIDVSHAQALYDIVIDKTYAPTYYDKIGHNDILNVMSKADYEEIIKI